MFTGIITDQGKVIAVEERANGILFRIKTAYDPTSIDIGASIACNGVCLTVVSFSGDDGSWFEVEAWAEALKLTNVVNWSVGTIINLERSLKMGDEFGGHMVSGHVDGLATIIEMHKEGDATRIVLESPGSLMKFIVPKGSICLDGTSLTVNDVDGVRFDVLLISHSLKVTTWGQMAIGDQINIEVDQMARYVVRILEQHHKTS